jgi:molybdopterin adenylyltransferase
VPTNESRLRVGILTVSDRASSGQYEDRSGPVLRDMVTRELATVAIEYVIVPDELDRISGALVQLSDELRCHLILTTGGTGFSPRDVTPEATRSVIEREAPGLVHAMLRDSLLITPHAMLSRAVAGIRGQTLIVNLPGSPRAVRENLEIILPALPHALELLRGSSSSEAGHESKHHHPTTFSSTSHPD